MVSLATAAGGVGSRAAWAGQQGDGASDAGGVRHQLARKNRRCKRQCATWLSSASSPEPLADFYVRFIGAARADALRVGRDHADRRPLQPQHPALPRGRRRQVHHPGVAIDDLDELKDRLQRYAPDATLEPRPGRPALRRLPPARP